MMDLKRIVHEVLPFGEKVKKRLISLGKTDKIVRIRCPNPDHTTEVYVRVGVFGRRNHLHMACEDEACHYRFME